MTMNEVEKANEFRDQTDDVMQYDQAIKCSNGFWNVRQRTRYGYLNEKCEEITPIKYEAPADFKGGFAIVKYDRTYFKLDENGNEIMI